MAAVAAGKDNAIFILKALSVGITFINESLDSYDRENPWFGVRTRANDHDRHRLCA